MLNGGHGQNKIGGAFQYIHYTVVPAYKTTQKYPNRPF